MKLDHLVNRQLKSSELHRFEPNQTKPDQIDFRMSESLLKRSLDIINRDSELKSKDHPRAATKGRPRKRKAKKEGDKEDKLLQFSKSASLIEQFKSQPEKRRLQLERNREKLKQMASLKVDKSFSKTLFKDFENDTKSKVEPKGSVFTEDDFLEFEKQFVNN